MLHEGARLNEFIFQKRLGSGAFGEVWLAENEMAVGSDPKIVALKIPCGDAQGLWEEATYLALLDHPNIVRFYRPGRTANDNGKVYHRDNAKVTHPGVNKIVHASRGVGGPA